MCDCNAQDFLPHQQHHLIMCPALSLYSRSIGKGVCEQDILILSLDSLPPYSNVRSHNNNMLEKDEHMGLFTG